MNKKLIQIARRYHNNCIKIHNDNCTGLGIGGKKTPANKEEAKRIRQKMKFELKWIKDLYSFDGIARSDINKAIKLYRSTI